MFIATLVTIEKVIGGAAAQAVAVESAKGRVGTVAAAVEPKAFTTSIASRRG